MDPTARRLAALFVIGLVALLSPLTGAFNRPTSVFGLPLFPSYLFGCWTALVLLAFYVARGGRR